MSANNANQSNSNDINVNSSQTDLSHPVFKKLSKLNGDVNCMTIEQLRHHLKRLDLEVDGSSESCKRRLKHYLKCTTMSKVFKKNTVFYYDVICILDFEATCDDKHTQQLQTKQSQNIQEIIEFPALMVDIKKNTIVSTFHEFVKPKVNDKLSEFCKEFTGISQDVIDNALPFPEVLDKFEVWFHNFVKENNVTSFAFATDGPWDMTHFFARQCKLYDIPYPSYAKRWINVRKVFASHYKAQSVSLDQMLAHLGMEFQGRKHCGYDDALNIASLLNRMIIDGANPVVNERISWHQVDRCCWDDMRCGYVRVFYNKPSDGLNVSDSEDSLSEGIYENLSEEVNVN